MRITLLINPSAGAGKALPRAQAYARALEHAGHHATLCRIPDPPPLADTDLLAIVGGDGTVHHTLPALLNHQASPPPPILHIPLGTENLFAREFGTRNLTPQRLVESLNAPHPPHHRFVACDVPVMTSDAGAVPFVIMWSAGPDASVVHRLNAVRQGPISHASYIRPILAELLDPTIPRVTIDVDGSRLVTDQPGWVVVANIRQYALRVNPIPRANPTDGLLDLLFCPAPPNRLLGGVSVLASMLRARLRLRNAVQAQGREIRIELASHRPADQLDGEPTHHIYPHPTPHPHFPHHTSLRFAMAPRRLEVLCLSNPYPCP
jgi:diacylglycerol kinase (ATP)